MLGMTDRRHEPIAAHEAPRAFEEFAAAAWSPFDGLDVDGLIEAMVGWYQDVRVVDAVGLDQDGDMVLFQFGVFDFGTGPSFQYDLTRQLVVPGSADDGIWQLSATVHYPVSVSAEDLGRGSRWCPDPAEAAEFKRFLLNHPATEFARNAPISGRTVEWGRV